MENGEELHSLLKLVLDNDFQKLEQSISSTSFFKIVGRTHQETWHSMFLSWLLDPHASHEMGFFALRKLLLFCIGNNGFCDPDKKVDIIKIITSDYIKVLNQFPSEKNPSELSVSGVGKFDFFLEIEYKSELENNQLKKAIVLIEQKVNDPIKKEQCNRYLDYLNRKYDTSVLVLPIFLSPQEQQNVSSKSTYGSDKWFGLNYQDLYDSILLSALNYKNTSTKAHEAIADYINTLRIPVEGRKLIVTKEEKLLAEKIFKNHRPAFEMLREILKEGEPEITTMIITSDERLPLKLNVNGSVISGETVPEFYKNCMNFLFEQGKEQELIKKLPIQTSEIRYLIAKDGKHQRGNEFYTPLIIKEGIIMESHVSRSGGLRCMARLLRDFGFTVE